MIRTVLDSGRSGSGYLQACFQHRAFAFTHLNMGAKTTVGNVIEVESKGASKYPNQVWYGMVISFGSTRLMWSRK